MSRYCASKLRASSLVPPMCPSRKWGGAGGAGVAWGATCGATQVGQLPLPTSPHELPCPISTPHLGLPGGVLPPPPPEPGLVRPVTPPFTIGTVHSLPGSTCKALPPSLLPGRIGRAAHLHWYSPCSPTATGIGMAHSCPSRAHCRGDITHLSHYPQRHARPSLPGKCF